MRRTTAWTSGRRGLRPAGWPGVPALGAVLALIAGLGLIGCGTADETAGQSPPGATAARVQGAGPASVGPAPVSPAPVGRDSAAGSPSAPPTTGPAGSGSTGSPAGSDSAEPAPAGSALTTQITSDRPAPPATTPPAPAPGPTPAVRPEAQDPGQGNVADTVPAIAISTQASLPLTAQAALGGPVSASIRRIAAVTAEPVGPGELAGPAVAVTVEIVNSGTDPVDLDDVDVGLDDSTGSPGLLSTGGPSAPVTGELPAGARAQGTYVFTVGESVRHPVTVTVAYSAMAVVARFVGDPA